MQISEIISLGAEGVKGTPEALDAYKRTFQETFGRLPECPACGSSVGINDWNAFTALSEGVEVKDIQKKFFNMSKTELEKTFKVFNSHELVHYVEERDGRLFVERSYVNSMSETFAVRFLETSRDSDELEARKRYFSVLPAQFRLSDEEIEANELLNDEPTLVDTEAGIVKNDLTKVEKTEEEIKAEKNAKRREAYAKNKK